MKKTINIIFFVLVICLGTYAQTNDYSYWSLNTGDGLSHSNVKALCSDSRGMLWIGTVYGLDCWDGYQVKNYFHEVGKSFSLPGNTVNMITEDQKGTIWIATDKGLVYYDRIKDCFIPPYSNINVRIFASHECKERIFFGGEGLFQYDFINQTFKELPLPVSLDQNLVIKGIHQWEKGVILLVLNSGEVLELNEISGQVKSSVFQISSAPIITSYLDSAQNLFLSIAKVGVLVYDKNGKLKGKLNDKIKPSIYDDIMDFEEVGGKLIMASDGGGIYVVDLQDYSQISALQHVPGNCNSLPANSITCICKDKSQNIWLGSVRDGVIAITQALTRTYKDVPLGNPYGLSNKAVISNYQDDDGYIWLGTDGGGVNRFNPIDDTFIHYSSTYGQKVISITEYSPYELLISCYNSGLYRFNKRTGECIPFTVLDNETDHRLSHSTCLVLLHRVSNNKFLIISRQSYLYDKSSNKFTLLKYSELPKCFDCYELVGQSENIIYLLQGNSILEANLDSCKISVFYDIANDEKVEVCHRDKNGYFWIGTDQGIRYLNSKTGEYKKLETNFFKRVSAIQSDQDNQLWIGAQNMLFSYDIEKETFSILGGLTDYFPNEMSNINQPPYYKEYIYLNSIHGMIRINKSMAKEKHTDVDIQLADITLDGISVQDSKGSMQIPWDYKTLLIRIKAIGKSHYRKKLFRYMINNKNEILQIDSYTPVLPLNLLSPGEYGISVSLYTQNGTWSNPVHLIDILILPPWYKNVKLLLAVMLLFVLLVYWKMHRIVIRKEQQAQWELNKVVSENNQEKIQFLLNISHELRTPLTLIYSPLKKIISQLEQPNLSLEDKYSLKKRLVSVHNAANQMKTIINMTLDLSKYNYQKPLLNIQLHDVKIWIQGIVEQFKYELEDRNITLQVRLDEQVEAWNFDDIKCGMVLSNFLMNALKFSPANSLIEIVGCIIPSGIRISVIDQGIGLGNAEPEKLFSCFYQGKHNELGSGIGLAYAKMIIQQHGGNIGAYSNKVIGSTFYFELPVKIEQAQAKDMILGHQLLESTSDSDLVRSKIQIKLSDYNILIVEDNDELRTFLAEALKNEYKCIFVANNGKEALKIMQKEIVDVVVSDIMMPLMGGYELCHRIKTCDELCHIPIVLLTALNDSDSTSTGYKCGANAYLSKPFELEVLQDLLYSILVNKELMKERYAEKYITAIPNSAVETVNRDEKFLLELNKIILDNLSSSDLNVTFLTEKIGMSRTPLYTKLKALTNLSVNDYINRIKIEKSTELLANTDFSISEISTQVGFEYHRYFSTLFKQLKGVSPSKYRQEIKKRES